MLPCPGDFYQTKYLAESVMAKAPRGLGDNLKSLAENRWDFLEKKREGKLDQERGAKLTV